MRSYQASNFLSRYFYTYVNSTINNINSKDCKIDVEDLEDMNRSSESDQTLDSIEEFKKIMQDYVDEYKKKGLKPDYYIILRNSCFWAFFSEIKFCVLHATLSESFAVFYSYFVG